MSRTIFERKIYQELIKWKECDGRSALLIEGPRRVGKTTVVREFGRKEYESCLMIDFMNPIPGTIDIFESYKHDIGLLTSNLALLYNVVLKERRSLIVFDEVQKYLKARELIKYLVLDGRYDYIETGSLISIKENVRDIQIPSEETSLQMHPMDFEEWLWAVGDRASMTMVREHFDSRTPLGQTMHTAIMNKYRLYMITGGMPGAVEAFLKGNDIAESEMIKRDILSLYRGDIRKKDGNQMRVLNLFDNIPGILSHGSKVFRPGRIDTGALTDQYLESLRWLIESKIVNCCISSTDPNIAMNPNNDFSRFKAYLADTGMLMTLAFDTGILDASALTDLAKSKLSVNEGMLFENVVAQELVSSGHRLYFTEFYRPDDPKHLYEIDFIFVRSGRVTPIEAKSSVSGKHVSLDLFTEKYGDRVDEAFVIHPRDLRMDGKITYLPVYMASLI